MRGKRKQYTTEFKARVALAAIKGERTINELAAHYEIHPNQITKWKKEAMAALPHIFSGKIQAADAAAESREANLYEEIGRLKFELDWLKKKLDRWD
jgi:putative transposase